MLLALLLCAPAHAEDVLLDWSGLSVSGPFSIYTNSVPWDLHFWRLETGRWSGFPQLGPSQFFQVFPKSDTLPEHAVDMTVPPLRVRLHDYTLKLRPVTAVWDPVDEASGYKVYHGLQPRSYYESFSTGETSMQLSLEPGFMHYFAVTATNSSGLESSYSAEAAFFVPLVNAPPAVIGGPRQWTLDGRAVYGPMSFSVADSDGDVASLTLSSSPTNGTLSGSLTNLFYTPNAGPPAEDFFSVTARDWRSSTILPVSFTLPEE